MTDRFSAHIVTEQEYNSCCGIDAACSHMNGFDLTDRPEYCKGMTKPGEVLMRSEADQLCRGCWEFLADAGEVVGGR